MSLMRIDEIFSFEKGVKHIFVFTKLGISHYLPRFTIPGILIFIPRLRDILTNYVFSPRFWNCKLILTNCAISPSESVASGTSGANS